MSESLHIGHLYTNPGWGGGEYQIINFMDGLKSMGVTAA